MVEAAWISGYPLKAGHPVISSDLRNALFSEVVIKQRIQCLIKLSRLKLEAGFRYNHIEMDSDRVHSSMEGTDPMVFALTNRFNSSNRNRNENEVDGVLRFQYEILPELTMGFGAARKTRTPTYQERYLYITAIDLRD